MAIPSSSSQVPSFVATRSIIGPSRLPWTTVHTLSFSRPPLHLLTSIAERKLQGEVRQTYIELLQRFPYIRRIFRFQDMQDPDEDEFEEEVPNIACFLLDSIEETATTEEHDRLLPKVELLLKNRVIGMGEKFAVPTSYFR